MSHFCKTILLLVRTRADIERILPTALWLSSSTGAGLHVLAMTEDPEALLAIEKRIRRDDRESPLLIGHDDLRAETLRGIRSLDASLLVLSVDQELERVIEESPVPVLLIPKRYEEQLPWRSILVPMSGEIRENHALELALDLASQLKLPVDIVHVTDPSEPIHSLIARYSDQPHHEYPEMLDEFIAQASPLTRLEEKRWIRSFHVLRGPTQETLLEEANRTGGNLIAVHWNASLMEGHARTLKAILESTHAAVLVTKLDRHVEFELRAGKNIDASPGR